MAGKGLPAKDARLLRIYELLMSTPDGLTAAQITRFTGARPRYVYRDIDNLQAVFGCTIEHTGKIFKIKKAGLLPPIRFSTMQAATIFIAARLLLGYSSIYNPNIISTFRDLSKVAPGPLREQILKTMDWMEKQKVDKQFLLNLDYLIQAWIKSNPVKISYRTPGKTNNPDRVIEPYFIQPAALERANYVIGKCRLAGEVRTFKIERIKSVSVLYREKYDIPADFDANEYLGKAWSISVHSDRPLQQVLLKFMPPIGHIARETRWHPSQVTRLQPDGSVEVVFTLSITEEVESFILGWGNKVEVLEPKTLRKKIAGLASGTANLYISQ